MQFDCHRVVFFGGFDLPSPEKLFQSSVFFFSPINEFLIKEYLSRGFSCFWMMKFVGMLIGLRANFDRFCQLTALGFQFLDTLFPYLDERQELVF